MINPLGLFIAKIAVRGAAILIFEPSAPKCGKRQKTSQKVFDGWLGDPYNPASPTGRCLNGGAVGSWLSAGGSAVLIWKRIGDGPVLLCRSGMRGSPFGSMKSLMKPVLGKRYAGSGSRRFWGWKTLGLFW
jgi:hypothetical protein